MDDCAVFSAGQHLLRQLAKIKIIDKSISDAIIIFIEPVR
jgi:hypothetical protein